MPSAHVFNNKDGALYTTSTGAPVERPYAAERVGKHGPLLIQGTPPSPSSFRLLPQLLKPCHVVGCGLSVATGVQ